MSDCIIGGYNMLDPNSGAGKSDTGLNLNSVSVRYMLETNPEMCRKVYTGEMPSYFGNGPTVTDCGTYLVPKAELESEGENVNPMQLVEQATGQPMPTYNFTGALAPQFHDNAQPTFRASSIVSGGSPMRPPTTPMMPYQMMNQPMYPQQPMMGFNNYMNPITPTNSNGEAMQEWEKYQRTKGFKAPIPTDTDFPGPGLLSGFHKGFDPHQPLLWNDDEFYDATLNGRIGISEYVHQQHLAQYANVWGYTPGQVIDRRENMMFPGIQEDHHIPTPSNNPVLNHQGVPQVRATPRQLGNTAIPINQLPMPNMVATNPYMAGMNFVGGMHMQQQTAVPTPYMQARYNYAIANGFQSVQEMDNNDFFVIKLMSRSIHMDMTEEEFAEHFENCWCKRFTDIYDAEKKMQQEAREYRKKEDDKQGRICAYITRGDEIIAGMDTRNDPAARHELMRRRQQSISYQQWAEIERRHQYDEFMKDVIRTRLYYAAPERAYDHDTLGYMSHGFVEAVMRDFDFQDWLWWNSPERYHVQQQVNQTEFMRNCLERGIGFGTPAAHSRLAMENKMFYVNEDLPTDNEDFKQYKGFIRGSYGKYPDGKPLEPGIMPLYGYITIADPKDPSRSIPFPRRYLKDLHAGFQRFAAASMAKSKTPFHVLDYDEFEKATGVRVLEDEEFLKEYGDFEPAQKLIDLARRSVQERKDQEDLMRPPHADSPNEDLEDFADPTADIPMDALLKDLEEEEEEERRRKGS